MVQKPHHQNMTQQSRNIQILDTKYNCYVFGLCRRIQLQKSALLDRSGIKEVLEESLVFVMLEHVTFCGILLFKNC